MKENSSSIVLWTTGPFGCRLDFDSILKKSRWDNGDGSWCFVTLIQLCVSSEGTPWPNKRRLLFSLVDYFSTITNNQEPHETFFALPAIRQNDLERKKKTLVRVQWDGDRPNRFLNSKSAYMWIEYGSKEDKRLRSVGQYVHSRTHCSGRTITTVMAHGCFLVCRKIKSTGWSTVQRQRVLWFSKNLWNSSKPKTTRFDDVGDHNNFITLVLRA